ncbi:hypothetical protein [Spirosoma spitsbergense]|uniref:hypothetical protein n=1 Tax=Spirosoma spitsbergense TaxID=431554 RepID=UPI0012F94BDA|nr:hypothetical protein [Spirosoma spitsbergense]
MAKLVFIAFWGMFFQCQATNAIAYTPDASSSHSQASHKGSFCKKKLTDGKEQISAPTVRQKAQKPAVPPVSAGYVNGFVRYLVQSLLPVSPAGDYFVSPSARRLMALHRANPNKAPPVCATA